ncbi:MAG: cell division protein FtsA [Bacteroidaceae bacterium]
MITDDFFIVAIEFGSSKVTGIAGKRQLDGSLLVLAMAQEESPSFINNGIIFNVDKTSQCIRNIVDKLQKTLKKKISKVYVGIGGQSLRSKRNVIHIPLAEETVVTQELIDTILDANLSTDISDCSILDVVPQEYKLGAQYQTDPVGVLSNDIEGRFLNIIARKSVHDVMASCFKQAGVEVCDYYISPLSLADGVLTDAEKRSGCVLVDLGAHTTTLLVYKGHLRHLVVLPIGSDNINKDLISIYDIERTEAEALKLKYGVAYLEESENEEDQNIKLLDGREISVKELREIIEARMREIIENVLTQIRISGIMPSTLLAGVFLTGGGANMKELNKAFVRVTKIEKFKIIKSVLFTVHSSLSEISLNNGRFNTVQSLLMKGTDNCCGGDIHETPASLFEEDNVESRIESNVDGSTTATDGLTEIQRRQKAAEEAKKIKAAEDAILAAEQAEKEKEAERVRLKEEKEARKKATRERRKAKLQNNMFTKMAKKFGDTLKNIVADNEETGQGKNNKAE